MAQAAAAGNGHPGDGNGADVVVPENLGQLFSVIHRIQLGAADQRHLILHEIVVKIAVGIGSAIRSDQQICAIEIEGIGRQQLDLHWEVGQFTGTYTSPAGAECWIVWQAVPGQPQDSGASLAFFAASTAASL